MKKTIIFLAALFIYISVFSQDQKLYVIIANVGQADAILIRDSLNMQEILIDAGGINLLYPESEKMFKEFIETYQEPNNPIEYVIATHPHADHIGNMQYVLNNYEVGNYIDNGLEYNSAGYRNTMELVKSKSDMEYNPMQNVGQSYNINGSIDLDLFWPCNFNVEKVDINNGSVLAKITFNRNEFLFVGDCETLVEDLLLKDPECAKKIKRVDFLKAGHHGSNTSSSEEFISQVRPKYVAISVGERGVGKNEDYKHPRLTAVNNLTKYAKNRNGDDVITEVYDKDNDNWVNLEMQKAVYLTKDDGTMIFVSDGRRIQKL
jgi:competence protein ComEC